MELDVELGLRLGLEGGTAVQEFYLSLGVRVLGI